MIRKISKHKKGILAALILVSFFTTMIAIRFTWSAPSPSTWYVGPVPPADFASIQQAINNETVMEGDIIEVMPEGGPYNEHVNVTKSLTIRRWSESSTECIIDGEGTGTVINVTASNVKIFNFTIQNGSGGLYLSPTSTNNTIVDNKITLNSIGMLIYGSSNNTLSRNELTDNSMREFGINAVSLADFIQHIDDSNTVDGKPIYYWVNEHDTSVPTNAGYVALVNCTNITVEGLAITDNMLLAYTNHSTIQNGAATDIYLSFSHNNTISQIHCESIDMRNSTANVVTECVVMWGYGIYLSYCSYNNLTSNNITSGICAIQALQSNNNTFYHNNIMNNTYQLVSLASLNTWDNGAEGNYWDDYTGLDLDKDGIGDTSLPHQGVDYYPLIKPWNPIRSLDITFLTGWLPINPTPYFISINSDHIVASITYYLNYDPIMSDGYITFNITAGNSGYCNVTIPRDRLDHPFDLTVNNILTSPVLGCNETHCSLYFTYTNGTHNIKIKSYRIGHLYGDITGPGPDFVPDGIVNMRDVGAVCNNCFIAQVPIVISEEP